MKNMILFLTVSLVSVFSVAGDGGFTLRTCVSDSGRTNLTIFEDNFSGAEVPVKVVFGIDGEFITYAPNATLACQEEECLTIRSWESTLFVGYGDTASMVIEETDGDSVVIQKGFYDPRKDYNSNSIQVGAISLDCKSYHQEP